MKISDCRPKSLFQGRFLRTIEWFLGIDHKDHQIPTSLSWAGMLPLEITQIPIQPDLEHSSDEESTVYSSDPPPSQKKNFFLESNLNLPPVESHHPLSCHSTPFYKVPPCLSHRIPLGTGRLLQNFFFSCFKTLETATLKARAAFREQRAGSPHRVFNN